MSSENLKKLRNWVIEQIDKNLSEMKNFVKKQD